MFLAAVAGSGGPGLLPISLPLPLPWPLVGEVLAAGAGAHSTAGCLGCLGGRALGSTRLGTLEGTAGTPGGAERAFAREE